MRFLFLVLFLAPACGLECIDGDGHSVVDQRSIDGFDRLQLEASGHLAVRQGDSYAVELRGEQNLLDRLEVFARNSTLFIRDKNDRCYDPQEELTYDVTLPAISKLEISGDGEITTESIDSPELRIVVSGSGVVDSQVTSQSLSAEISGSGDVTLAGVTETLDLEISGSGHIDAYDLTAARADVEISGSGEAFLTVTDELDAEISGSGDVRYQGNPHVSTDISGSGEVRAR